MPGTAPSIRTSLIISLLLHSTVLGGIAELVSKDPSKPVEPSAIVVELISSQKDASAAPLHAQAIHTTERLTPSQDDEKRSAVVEHDPQTLLPAESDYERRTPVSTVDINGENSILSPTLPDQKVIPVSGTLYPAEEESSHLPKTEQGLEERGSVSEAPAKESPAEGKTDLDDYLRQVSGRLERAKRYPWLAKIRGWEGTARLQFIITPSGEAENIRLVQSSGWKSLDDEALALIERVGRFPSPPRIEKEGIHIQVPLAFQLKGP